MIFKNQLKRILTGLTIPQEYVCLTTPELQSALSVLLTTNDGGYNCDVSSTHLFLGYKPLIIGLSFRTDDHNHSLVKSQDFVQLSFRYQKSSNSTESAIGRLSLKKIEEKNFGEVMVIIYEGRHGEHSFLNAFHRWSNRQLEKRRKDNPNNVGLPGNLVDQVRIAYSIPRKISIITTSDGNSINQFPTDLHGAIEENFYAGSLRVGGLANEQVERYKQIVISEVESSSYKQAYALGKNHMRDLRSKNEFQLHPTPSEKFSFPLPESVISYRELKKIDSFDVGIHRIHFYEVINQRLVQTIKSPLTHIHQYYAQWRFDRGLQTPMLLR